MRSHKPPNGKAPSLQAIFYQRLTSDRWDLMEHFGTDSSGKVCLGDSKRPTPAPTQSWSPLTTLAQLYGRDAYTTRRIALTGILKRSTIGQVQHGQRIRSTTFIGF